MTNLLLSINDQLSVLRVEHGKLMDRVINESDIKAIRVEIEGQKIDKLDKESSIELLRVEVERLGKLIGGLAKKSDMQSIREELDRLKKDGVEKESDLRAKISQKESEIQSLKTDIQSLRVLLEGQKKTQLDMESRYQSIRMEQVKLTEGLVKKTDKQDSRFKLHNCTEVKTSGIYNILLSNINSQPFKVACDAETRGGGWTIILRRMDGTVEFNRNWTEYQKGFGEVSGEFFLGLDKIHELTAERKQELLVILEDFEGVEEFETYDEFGIGDENQEYVLHTLGKANGTAGDSFSRHKDSKFSTFDRDNDPMTSQHCAEEYTGGWWYCNGCYSNKLTGQYTEDTENKGIHWKEFRGLEYSLKKAVLMIRPKSKN
ncbi:ficolin-1-like [Drosophila innubila]|uniref:ficolin-1-like n=1 Tax=Drosophila innubila TaxID=198719 RepID=UPI00148CE9E6|nr:ficolin-1-like [Drosophila innubila]